MIKFEEALNIIRRLYPNDLIRECITYRNKYIFAISLGKKYYKDDSAIFFVAINSNKENELFDFWDELLSNKDPEFTKAIENPIYVDVTKEMLDLEGGD